MSAVAKSAALFCCESLLTAQTGFVARAAMTRLHDLLVNVDSNLAARCSALADSSPIDPRRVSILVDDVRYLVANR